MASYESAALRIISELTRSDASVTSFVQLEMKDAIDYYSTTRFWFNEARATFTTSSGQSTYTGTTGILEIDSVVITLGSSKFELKPVNYAVLNALDLGNITGQPSVYAYWQESFRLYPVPNASFTVAIEYQQRFATLSASGDTNAFLNVGLPLISARVKKNLMLDRWKDAEAAGRYQRMEDEALSRLFRQTEKLLTTGRLVAD